MDLIVPGLLAVLTAGIGAVAGLGGAVLLVPALIFLGFSPLAAAPLGFLSVAAGSLTANARQLESGLVHHRLGLQLELAATAGAIAGVLAAGMVPASVLVRLLGLASIAAGLVAGARRGMRNVPSPRFGHRDIGEWWGSLAGAYEVSEGVVPYRARRASIGAALIGVAGVVAGLTGTSGGYIKTPVMSEVMHVPVKVAAATSVFMASITAAAALMVSAFQGRVDYLLGSAVVAGGLLGGVIGAGLQDRLRPQRVRRAVSALLVLIGLLLVVRG